MTDPAAHTPSDSAGAPDVDTLEGHIAHALRWVGGSEHSVAMSALSDLAAIAREATDLPLWRRGHKEQVIRAEAAEADRERCIAALIKITDRKPGDPSATEIARCALGWPSS